MQKFCVLSLVPQVPCEIPGIVMNQTRRYIFIMAPTADTVPTPTAPLPSSQTWLVVNIIISNLPCALLPKYDPSVLRSTQTRYGVSLWKVWDCWELRNHLTNCRRPINKSPSLPCSHEVIPQGSKSTHWRGWSWWSGRMRPPTGLAPALFVGSFCCTGWASRYQLFGWVDQKVVKIFHCAEAQPFSQELFQIFRASFRSFVNHFR